MAAPPGSKARCEALQLLHFAVSRFVVTAGDGAETTAQKEALAALAARLLPQVVSLLTAHNAAVVHNAAALLQGIARKLLHTKVRHSLQVGCCSRVHRSRGFQSNGSFQ